MLSIDEAITKYKEITNTDEVCPAHCNIPCEKCLQESEQLAGWLEELKSYRENSNGYTKEDIELNRKAMYNKALDDFVKEICKMIVQSENNGNYRFYAVEIKQAIADLAEQLKAGGK